MDDVKHGFTEDELATVMAAFDTHPEAGNRASELMPDAASSPYPAYGNN